MLIFFFLAALVSGALTMWLLWSFGFVVALTVAAGIASMVVVGLAALVVATGSRASASPPQWRDVLDLLGKRHPR